jgi:hypothetical protein
MHIPNLSSTSFGIFEPRFTLNRIDDKLKIEKIRTKEVN